MATTQAPARTGLYLYGITVAERIFTPGAGVGGADVEAIVVGDVAAVVSRLGGARVRPQRAHLAAHHRLLNDLARRHPVLPVVFGTITGDEEQLRRLLRDNHDALAGSLRRVAGKAEMGLKVFWDLPNVFEYFVATHQELETMRNRLFRPGRSPSVEEKMEIGELFVSLLAQARQRHTQLVKDALAPYCADIRAIDPGEERMIMKLACLVDKDGQEHWEEGVRQAALLFDDHYRFDYNGPWPPYNFAPANLSMT